jgi:hypothetical protein
LRDALSNLDGAIFTLFSLVASDDVNLDTVQEIVTVLKNAQGDIGDVTALLATKANASTVTQLVADTAASLSQIANDTAQALSQLASELNAALVLKADAAQLPVIAGIADAGKSIVVNSAGTAYTLGAASSLAESLFYSGM